MVRSVELLQRKKGHVMATLTRLERFVDDYDPNQELISVEDINVRLEMLEKAAFEFRDIIDELEEQNIDCQDMDIFDPRYLKLKADLRTFAKRKGAGQESSTKLSEAIIAMTDQQQTFFEQWGQHTLASANSSVKLPKLVIKPFSGVYAEFAEFRDTFESAVHMNDRLADVQKFQYLKGLLIGDAAQIIRGLKCTNENYLTAWRNICERYNKPKNMIMEQIKKFMDQPSTEGVARKLRDLLTTSNAILQEIDATSKDARKRDPWLIYFILSKVDHETRETWATYSIDSDYPTCTELFTFLNERCDAMESCEMFSSKSVVKKPNVKTFHASAASSPSCLVCDDSHELYRCPEFKRLSVQNRRDLVVAKNLCYNCLSASHISKVCTSKYSCIHCRRRHHTTLHEHQSVERDSTSSNPSFEPTPSTSSSASSSNLEAKVVSHHVNCNENGSESVNQQNAFHSILPTALVYVKGANGLLVKCRVLLDSGSQASFISEECIYRLKLGRTKARYEITGISSSGVTTRGATRCEVISRHDTSSSIVIEALILAKLSTMMASSSSPTGLGLAHWASIKNLQLADPDIMSTRCIDILLGADHFFHILRDGQKLDGTGLVAQNTMFGWVISGNHSILDEQHHQITNFHLALNVDETLRKFWELEELPSITRVNPSEHEAENHYTANLNRDNHGRYVVSLPLIDEPILGNSMNSAVKRFSSLEKRFAREPNIAVQYAKFMEEYLQLGHMEQIPEEEVGIPNDRHFYLPHHAVIKSSSTTTKLRVVFDGSCKTTSGASLNDKLLIGPTIQPTLWSTLLRFRSHSIGITADIEKMYRQVMVSSDDTNYQRIVWRVKPDDNLAHYRLTTVTYGTSCAPFLAVRTLQQISEDYKNEFPRAAVVLHNDFYVDDLLTGAENINVARQLKNDLIELLAKAGMCLRKWSSNASEQWNSTEDYFTFGVHEFEPTRPTKRQLLSEASRIFDPMGWLAPSTVLAKILLQELWKLKLDWDTQLPDDISKQWLAIRSTYKVFKNLRIPRNLPLRYCEVELHGFCDASEVAYGAVVYLRAVNEMGSTITRLITSKTKVAPIKQVTLARLELCGAHLLADLLHAISSESPYKKCTQFAWTDSTVVLHWLSDFPRRWKTFVANRTSAILEILPRDRWNYVRSKDNPADWASRGQYPTELVQNLQWWRGPDWLDKPKIEWPSEQPFNISSSAIQREERVEKSSNIRAHPATIENSVLLAFFHRTASWATILRYLAYWLRFSSNLRASSQDRSTGFLTWPEIHQAEEVILKWAQLEFHEDIVRLRNHQPLKSSSHLIRLAPFMDNNGILRVGGRLHNAQISERQKHPAILPKNHIVAQRIIEETHIRHLHPGPSLLCHILKSRYWILDARNMVRRTTRQCVTCAQQRGTTSQQLMGQLPTDRVTPSRPFANTGVDYAGPISLLTRRGRGSKVVKGYIAIFVCLSIRAIHLEVVSNLSTSSFIAALRRFTARRGMPDKIYSDNGTNFLGANRRLTQMHRIERRNNSNDRVARFWSTHQVEWHFVPPMSPHFGGLWEAGVKSTKQHLLRVINRSNLTFEEMTTLLCQIEAVLNSRPMTPASEDIEDLNILTPAHFLHLSSESHFPDGDNEAVPETNLSRWENIQRRVRGFWHRFKLEYLNTLQQRNKWQKTSQNIKIGDLVIIRNENTPPGHWARGRIIQTHPGDDGLVRVVTVKTSTSTLTRPITKICVLPLAS